MKTLSISLFTLLAAATANAAAYTEQYNFKGNGANAWLYAQDGDCGYAYSDVSVGTQKQLGPNSWGGQWGYMSFGQGNWCTGDWSYGWADLSTATFSSNGARGARVQFEGTGYTEEFIGCELVDGPEECWNNCWTDENGDEICEEYCWDGDWWNCTWDYTSVPVSIDLTWSPTDTSRGVHSEQYKGSNYVSRYRTVGSTGYGPVTGTASFDGFEFGDSYGSCYAATSGSAWIYHFSE